jgi:3-deoxy-D-manno-octulosonate cytidylyltransferase
MKKERIIAVIPARFAASRFPGKMMALLGGIPVIRRTYEAAAASGLFDMVYAATDSPEIAAEIRSHGGAALMTSSAHSTGSDRIAQAIADIPCGIVVNVQGDEPLVQRQPLAQVLELLQAPHSCSVDVASLMHPISDPSQIADPNCVKVAASAAGRALMFSRSPIPYHCDKSVQAAYYKHIGVYAFRRDALLAFGRTPPTPLERLEKLECLRMLELGMHVKMAVTAYTPISIDTPADLLRAEQLLAASPAAA